ncbi:hypothetical protein, partial [Streptomyces sp. NPDC090112]|uniref:hypothetical protein n=1 Tax=Streptomyces sp. NPDC090112 TaxID=3365949 RepID=UPI00381FF766
GYLRGAAMVLVDLLRQDRNPGIRDSTNLSTTHQQLAQDGGVSGMRDGQAFYLFREVTAGIRG